jgi:hypothetical protein
MSIRYLFEIRFLILAHLLLFFCLLGGVVQGETSARRLSEAKPMAEQSGDIAWKNMETKYTIVHYQAYEDLQRFNHKVRYGQEQWSLKRLFSNTASDDLMDRVRAKVDALFERVQEILDMRKKMRKVRIRVYHDKAQLHDAYSRIYKGPCRIRAWFRYKNNTVYVNVNDLHEGMLAHELAHAIIDHYLLVRPPIATAEILARYVDGHLFE